MSEFDLTLPKPTKETLKRCNELLMVYTFKSIVDKISPEYIETFITINAKVFNIVPKDVKSIFSLIKDDITAFTLKEVAVCTYYLSGNGMKENYLLKLFNIKKNTYKTTLKKYMAFEKGESLESKLPKETMQMLNNLIEKLSYFASDITLCYKKINDLIKGE